MVPVLRKANGCHSSQQESRKESSEAHEIETFPRSIEGTTSPERAVLHSAYHYHFAKISPRDLFRVDPDQEER